MLAINTGTGPETSWENVTHNTSFLLCSQSLTSRTINTNRKPSVQAWTKTKHTISSIPGHASDTAGGGNDCFAPRPKRQTQETGLEVGRNGLVIFFPHTFLRLLVSESRWSVLIVRSRVRAGRSAQREPADGVGRRECQHIVQAAPDCAGPGTARARPSAVWPMAGCTAGGARQERSATRRRTFFIAMHACPSCRASQPSRKICKPQHHDAGQQGDVLRKT